MRVKYAPKPKDLGRIQMGTAVVRIEDGIRYYLYSVINIRGKFALTLLYKRADTGNTLNFFKELECVHLGDIKSVQTDNGSKFLGMFEEHLVRNNIKHYFIYSRYSKLMEW